MSFIQEVQLNNFNELLDKSEFFITEIYKQFTNKYFLINKRHTKKYYKKLKKYMKYVNNKEFTFYKLIFLENYLYTHICDDKYMMISTYDYGNYISFFNSYESFIDSMLHHCCFSINSAGCTCDDCVDSKMKYYSNQFNINLTRETLTKSLKIN